MSFCAHYEQYGADALAWPGQGKNLKSFFFLSTLFSFFSAPKPPDPRNLAHSTRVASGCRIIQHLSQGLQVTSTEWVHWLIGIEVFGKSDSWPMAPFRFSFAHSMLHSCPTALAEAWWSNHMENKMRMSLGSEERGAFCFCRSGRTVPPFPLLINFDVNDGSGWISGLARMFCWIPVVRRRSCNRSCLGVQMWPSPARMGCACPPLRGKQEHAGSVPPLLPCCTLASFLSAGPALFPHRLPLTCTHQVQVQSTWTGPSVIQTRMQAFSLTFLPATPFVISAMEQGLACLAAILESADPALQVPAEVGHRVAQRLQAEIGYLLPLFGAETDLQHLLPLQQHCSECNAVLSRCDSLKTQAVILHTAGPISKHHIPVRCRNRTCQRCSVLMWHNYSVESGKHIFTGCPHELRCFMLTSSFGFSIAWLQQFHARLVRQHASFIGESDVVREHARACGQEHLLPTARLRLLISEGWFKWRLLLRTYGCRQPVAASPSIDLRKDIDELLEPFMPAFQADFTKEATNTFFFN